MFAEINLKQINKRMYANAPPTHCFMQPTIFLKKNTLSDELFRLSKAELIYRLIVYQVYPNP